MRARKYYKLSRLFSFSFTKQHMEYLRHFFQYKYQYQYIHSDCVGGLGVSDWESIEDKINSDLIICLQPPTLS